MADSSSLTRRRFLGRTAAAFAAPYFIPRSVFASEGRAGANDRIGIGHIGVGGRGQSLMDDTLQIPDGAIVALADVDRQMLAQAHKKAEGAKTYADYRKLLDDPDVDVVVIATPDHWHALGAIHACQAGKDVYCEKPASNTIAEGAAMIKAVRAHNRILQIGSQGRSHLFSNAAANYIRNGQIGQVTNVRCWHALNREGPTDPAQPTPEHLDWDMWLGPAAERPYHQAVHPFGFRWVLDLGGGNIRDRGAHIFSNALWYLDADRQHPVSVEALGAPPRKGVYDTPTLMQVTYTFKNPDWTLVWEQPGHRPDPGLRDYGAIYEGDRGSLWVEGGDGGVRTEQKAMDYRPPAGGIEMRKSRGHMLDFIDSVHARRDPIMPIEAGVQVANLCIMGNLSYLLGRKLEWDGAAQRFVGDDEANGLLSRPGRGAWVVA